MADFEMVLEFDHGECWAHIGRGICRAEFLGERDWALDDINASVELAPHEPDADFHRGDAFREMGWVDEARSDYEVFLEMASGEF